VSLRPFGNKGFTHLCIYVFLHVVFKTISGDVVSTVGRDIHHLEGLNIGSI